MPLTMKGLTIETRSGSSCESVNRKFCRLTASNLSDEMLFVLLIGFAPRIKG